MKTKWKKLSKKEVDRLIKKYDKVEHRLAMIDEAVDKSLMVSKKMLDKEWISVRK
jgi:hypothetical protein